MIQLNLLPDVKLEYIKAQKMRSLVMSISVIVTCVAVAILALLLIFGFAQKAAINSNKTGIANLTNEIQNKPNINTKLTVQNQLESLGNLYAGRPAAYRLFTNFLSEVTPETVSINNLQASFTQDNATITGTADSLTTVNQYVDTLKLTTYKVSGSTSSAAAFTDVVLSNFGLNNQSQSNGQNASFTINLNFAAPIFQSTQNVSLSIPSIALTHYQQSDTGSLFQAAPATPTKAGGQ